VVNVKFEKSIIQSINRRVSKRAYENRDIEKKKLQKINQILKKKFTGPLGGKSRFELIECRNEDPTVQRRLGTYGFVRGARYFIAGILNQGERKIVDFGYCFEKIILKMTEIDLGTVWLGSTFRYGQFESCLDLNENEYIAATTPVGYSLEKPKAYERIISWGIASRRRKAWTKLFFLNDFSNPLTEKDAGKYATVLEMVRIGPSARNEQPWRVIKEEKSNTYHFYLQLRRKREAVNLPAMKQMDMGIALCHFDLTAKEKKLNGKFVIRNPGIDTLGKNLYYIASWISK
jgi:nitroreductase